MKTLKQSYKSLFPSSHKFLQSNSLPPKIFLNHPIKLHQQQSSCFFKAQKFIPNNSTIMMISTMQCFTSQELTGATRQEKLDLEEIFNELKQEADIFTRKQKLQLMKIAIQVYANAQQLQDNQMPLHDLAKQMFSMKQIINSVNYIQDINSFHLLNILQARERLYKMIYEVIKKKILKNAQQQQFNKVLNNIRFSIRSQSQITFIAPYLAYFGLSFNPNTKIVGKYMPHLRNSYFCVQTVKQIQPNQAINLSYPPNLTNYQLLQRYGKVQKDNPYHQYILIANMGIPQILMKGDIDAKQRQLSQRNILLKNIVRLNQQSQINKEDLSLLRILFSESAQIDVQSNKNDKIIYGYVRKAVEEQLMREKRRKKSTKTDDNLFIKSIREIEENDERILKNFLKKNL